TELGLLLGHLGKMAGDIALMAQTEIGELAEPEAPGKGGSSAMPHKRNPVLTENLTGLARLVRMAVIPAMENVALWHERDIS
ncbi:lyase family protein, partial [Salmonella enterica subsp. enterica serovar 1,4,[5],12:i:-]